MKIGLQLFKIAYACNFLCMNNHKKLESANFKNGIGLYQKLAYRPILLLGQV